MDNPLLAGAKENSGHSEVASSQTGQPSRYCGRSSVGLALLAAFVGLLALLERSVGGTVQLDASGCEGQKISVDDVDFDQMDLNEYEAPKGKENLAPVDAFNDVLRTYKDWGSGIYWQMSNNMGQLVWAGVVEGKPGDIASVSTRYSIASASKLYAGLAAMRTMQLKPHEFYPRKWLHEFKGWEHFNEFPVHDDPGRYHLNIYHLLTHTSGLPFALRDSKEDIRKMTLFYRPGTAFGYTLGHRVIGWLLLDFWRDQPETKDVHLETVQDVFKWLVFDPLEMSCETRFEPIFDKVFGMSGDAADASIATNAEDFMKLAQVALRKGKLPDGSEFISEENWNKWAMTNLLPDQKLTQDLVGWEVKAAKWSDWNVGGAKAEIMKQSGAYGWNYFGATYPLSGASTDVPQIGWCGFFAACLFVNYRQAVAAVLMQRDVADLKKSKPYLRDNVEKMAESLVCKNKVCSSDHDTEVACEVCDYKSSCWEESWKKQCQWSTSRGKSAVHDVWFNNLQHKCYKPFCEKTGKEPKHCPVDTGGTCNVLRCRSSRGETDCKNGMCICKHGYCAQEGTCRPAPLEPLCCRDTGGTCRIYPCDASRGAHCRAGQCLCSYGDCAEAGHCMPGSGWRNKPCDLNSGGTCSVMNCDASRGATNCINGLCWCQDGYCDDMGKCIWRGSGPEVRCPRETGGTCNIFPCAGWRGPTDCMSRQCICKAGFCSRGGACHHRQTMHAMLDWTNRTSAGWHA